MSRRPIDERSGPATETLTLRLTADDRALLDGLVALRAAELVDEGIEVTAASYVRGLIRRDAKAKGLLGEGGEPAPNVARAAAPKPSSPPSPAAVRVHAALLLALNGGMRQADIARGAAINSGQLSRFKTEQGTLSEETLGKLAAFLKS